MKKIFFILWLFCVQCTFCQETATGNTIGQQFSIAPVHAVINDSLLTDYMLHGNAIKFTYSISMLRKRRTTGLYLAYENARLNNEVLNTTLHSFDFIWTDAYGIFRSRNKKLTGSIGYAVSAAPSYHSGNYYSWNSAAYVSLYQSYYYGNRRQGILLDITIPVAGAVYRPKQLYVSGSKDLSQVVSTIYTNPSFASLHNYRAVNILFAYQRHLGPRLTVSARYIFEYKNWMGLQAFTGKLKGFGLSVIYN